MRSIKQIVRELKNEVLKLVDESIDEEVVNEDYLDEELDDEFFDEEDSLMDDSIEKMYNFILDNYDKEEIEILVKYLLESYFAANIEILNDNILGDQNELNDVYKNLCCTRLKFIFEELAIYNDNTLDEIDNILDIVTHNIDTDNETIIDYIKKMIKIIKENNLYDEFVNNEDFYYVLLDNYYILNEDDVKPIFIPEVKRDEISKFEIDNLEDAANVILDDLFYCQNYYEDFYDTLVTLDLILNQELKVQKNFYLEYIKYLEDEDFIFNEQELIDMMKVCVIKNYYKFKIVNKLITPYEKPIIEKIENYFDDNDVLINIYDEDYDSSKKFLEECIAYFKYKLEIDEKFKKKEINKNIDNMAIINNKVNKKLTVFQKYLDSIIKIDGHKFKMFSKYIDDTNLITISTNLEDKITLNKKDVLEYLEENEDVTLTFKINNYITKYTLMLEYLLKTDEFSEHEKQVFINSICENYLNSAYNDNDFVNILKSNKKKDWYKIFTKDINLGIAIFSNHIQKLESMNNKINVKNINVTPEKCIYASNLYENMLKGIINDLKLDPIRFTDDEIVSILYNYLCDVVSINKDYYNQYFSNNNYKEELIKYIFRFIIISNYYKYLKNQDSLNNKENNYINIIETTTKSYIDAYFTSDKLFFKDSVITYLKSNYILNIKNDDTNETVLKKIEPFYHKKTN